MIFNEKIKLNIDIKKIIGKNGIFAFLTTFITGIITHYYLYANNVLAPDAIATGNYKIAGSWEFSLGRWGISFFDKLRGGLVNEFLIIVICLIFLGISAIFICKIFNINKKIYIALISILLAVAPQFSETFLFIYCADSYCFAMLSAVLAVYFFKTKMKKNVNYIFSMLLIIVSLSLYQAYIAITVSLLIIYAIIDLLSKRNWKDVLKYLIIEMLIVLLGMILYFLITKIILQSLGIALASYKGANQMGIKSIIINLPETLKSTYQSFFDYYFKDNILYNTYWHREIINIFLFVITFIYMIYISIKNEIYKEWPNGVIILLLLLVLPIGIDLINIIMPATRINIVTGPALILMYVFIIVMISKNEIINLYDQIYPIIIVPLITIMLWTFVCSDNATYFARDEVFKNYYTISMNILEKVQDLEGYNKDMKWMFSDNIRYTSKFAPMANGTISNDYETWNIIDGIWMNIPFYTRYLGTNINMCNKEEYYRIIQTEEFREMEEYPNKGCVKIIDDIVVIKITANTY